MQRMYVKSIDDILYIIKQVLIRRQILLNMVNRNNQMHG